MFCKYHYSYNSDNVLLILAHTTVLVPTTAVCCCIIRSYTYSSFTFQSVSVVGAWFVPIVVIFSALVDLVLTTPTSVLIFWYFLLSPSIFHLYMDFVIPCWLLLIALYIILFFHVAYLLGTFDHVVDIAVQIKSSFVLISQIFFGIE